MAKRDYKTGGLRERAPGSWELKIRARDPRTGQRVARFYTFKGTRIGAKQKLRDLMLAAETTGLPDEKILVCTVIDAWEGTLNVSPKTRERYLELVKLYIRPKLGDLRIRSVASSRLEQFYSELGSATGPGLAPRTIGHIHRLVVQIFDTAMRDNLIPSNPAPRAKRPQVEETELEILDQAQVRDVLSRLRGRNAPSGQIFYMIVLLALSSGMRRGEILAPRWKDLNIDTAELRVERSVEQTKQGLRFKSPKTKRGRRTVTLPASVVAALRSHRASQSVQRLSLGLGKDADDGLIFRLPDGSPMLPNNVTTEWRRLVESLNLPKVSFHAFRHTHASQLIASGMDVLTISRRLGHSKPSVTLNIYGHLFKPTDKEAAALVERALGMSLPE